MYIHIHINTVVSRLFSRSDEKANDLDGGSWTKER